MKQSDIKLSDRGKKLFLSMSRSLPRFVDAITISLFIEKLKATSLSARIKRKIIKNIKKAEEIEKVLDEQDDS